MTATRLFIVVLTWQATLWSQEAIVMVPVADLLGQPMQSILKKQNKNAKESDIKTAYENLPAATERKEDCPRLYQLLFYERVKILEEQGCEIKIEVPHALYGVGDKGQLAGIYWTLKQNVALLKNFDEKLIQQAVAPSRFELNQKNIMTLQKPFFHDSTNLYFSAGTRFIVQEPKHHTWKTTILDPKNHKPIVTYIPKDFLIGPAASEKEAQQAFVRLLRKWALFSSKKTINYVWGGASFNFPLEGKQEPVQSGFDCAGLIIRAAQSCSIPFFLKNSSAQMYHLNELKENPLEEGDIIWFPGHVMVISSLARNTIIESRGYASGFGKLHEIPISTAFKDITTMEQLIAHYRKKLPLILLNSQGNFSTKITTYKIVRFSSVWQNAHKHHA
ncbi:MAG: hypothetical protein ABUT20_61765 [Bacteroidota bacterium]